MWSDIKKSEQFTKNRKVHWDSVSSRKKGKKINYYQQLLHHYYRFLIPQNSSILELGCGHGHLLAALQPLEAIGIDLSQEMVNESKKLYPNLTFMCQDVHKLKLNQTFDAIIVSDLLNDIWDAQWVLKIIRRHSNVNTRIIINTHSRLWQPILNVAEKMGLATPGLQQNWLAKNDILNLLEVEGFKVIKSTSEILFPLKIPMLSTFLNRGLAKLAPFKWFNLTHLIVTRISSYDKPNDTHRPGVSVIVACRNEEGNIPKLFNRIPQMGSGTEVIFVEGGSTDQTFETIEKHIQTNPGLNAKVFKQSGKGKGDAVRLGFKEAKNEILMILDADMTVSPEDLPRFYEALISGKGEFINGVRLVYPMEKEAMRFFNLMGNKFFSMVFSWILEQSIKDTLCGTKVMTKTNYEKIVKTRSYFGDFDPFGDFDLIFGAAKQNLQIVDMPIRYGERTYGDTNIERWKHGLLLLKMAIFAARRIKFI